MQKYLPLFFSTFFIGLSAQNTCTEAQEIVSGTYVTGEIDGTQIPTPGCTNAMMGVSAANWYAYTAAIDGIAIISSNLDASEGRDTRLHVYNGTCGSLVCAGFNDNIAPDNLTSSVTIGISAGETYYIAWDNYWESTSFSFNISENVVDCTTAIPFTETFNNENTFLACYTSIDADGDNIAWGRQELDVDNDGIPETFAINGSTASAKNDWLFSPDFQLEAGTAYQITYKFNGANNGPSPAHENFAVVVTDSPSPDAGFQEVIASHTNVTMSGSFAMLESSATVATAEFTPATSGNYNFAFHATTPANAGGNGFLLIFDYGLDLFLGISDQNAHTLSAYPNPVENKLTISKDVIIDSVEIYNIAGQLILSNSYSTSQVEVDLSTLNIGAYFAKIRSGSNIETLKIIKN